MRKRVEVSIYADEKLRQAPAETPAAIRQAVERIGENCEPALTTVMFMAGAGGSLRAGVTENPIRLTRSIKEALVRVTSGGAPVYIWPGGGITYMVDVSAMPDNAYGHVPTPAIVAPIEFTMRLEDYRDLGGHMGSVRSVESVIDQSQRHLAGLQVPLAPRKGGEGRGEGGSQTGHDA